MLKIAVVGLIMCSIFCLQIQAQNVTAENQNPPDSIHYDTVIVVKEPVVIKKTVVVESDCDFYENLTQAFGFNFSGLAMIPDYSTEKFSAKQAEYLENAELFRLSQYAGMHYNIGKDLLGLSIGMSLLNYRSAFHYHSAKLNYYVNDIVLRDTLDDYFVINGSDTAHVYVVDEEIITVEDSLLEWQTYSHERGTKFLSFPLGLNGNFQFDKLHVNPFTEFCLIYEFASKIPYYSFDDKLKPRKMDLSSGSKFHYGLAAGISLSYEIDDHIQFGLKYYYLFIHRKDNQNLKGSSLGLSLMYSL